MLSVDPRVLDPTYTSILTYQAMSGSSENPQLNVQGYNIVTILKRLEAATSRLEDVSIYQEELYKNAPKSAVDGSPNTKAISSSTASSTPSAPSPKPIAPIEKAKFVIEFENFIKDHIDPFVESSESIDLLVGEAAQLLKSAFAEQVKFLDIVSKTKKPDTLDPLFLLSLSPMNNKMEEISSLKNANRQSEFFNHLNTIGEGAPVLGWIVTETPVSFIPEFKDSAQFWSNRVMKEYREKDPKHVEWVKQYLSLFDALKAYVKEFHMTGPSWNAQGQPLADSLKAASLTPAPSAPGASAGGPPPPPPPPPPSNLYAEASEPKSGGINAVFADLNKGSDVTSGLRKVEKSEMTHKNPLLRKEGAIANKPLPPKKPTNLSKAATAAPVKAPRKELVDGSKWVIENFTEASAPEPIEIEVEKTQSVFIGNTSGVTIVLKGKGNAISISETKKTGVVVESLISGIDVIKSFKFGVQVTGVVPLISVDKCEEGSIYLSKESVDASSLVVTSNSSAININVLEGEDFVELPVPEQLSHTIKNGKIVSEVIEHAG